MRILLQRVSEASVIIENSMHANIHKGLLVFLGICHDDTDEDCDWLIQKIINMRIFSDEDGKMNLSVLDVNGSILVVSQFTLHASTKKGNRPSFIQAARPEQAIPLYEAFLGKLKKSALQIQSGVFGADMKVQLINDGPVTIFMDSKLRE
jgi:D-aminoacyl-tRNA deacylase